MWTIGARGATEPAVVSPIHAWWSNRTSDGRRGRIVTGAVEATGAASTRLVAVGLPRRPLESSTTPRGNDAVGVSVEKPRSQLG